MSAPLIDPLPTAPSRGSESREQFVLTTDAFLGALGPWTVQVNAFGDYLNDFAAGQVDWGDIDGTLADQTDLQAALDAKLDASVTKAELDTAVSDGNVCFDGDAVTNLTMTSARFLARTTGGGGAVEELTFSQVRAALDLEVGTDVQAYSSVLANTTASFTTADETKLDGIEALADVTDETNVVAALSGATLTDVGTPASGDKILLLDASNSDNLKYAAFSTFGGGGSAAWGGITGTLSDQTDLQSALDAKAPSTSPTFATSITGSFLTASRILGSDGSKNIVSLDTATYPSLTELAHVKGVTSAIQTQLAAKAASGANTDITALDQDVTITATGTIAANSLGFRGLPTTGQSQGSTITLALDDAGKAVPNTSGGWTIPANASIAFPVGTTIILINNSGSSQNIAITSDTLRLAGTASTGTRALAQYGIATVYKIASTTWIISGAGVS